MLSLETKSRIHEVSNRERDKYTRYATNTFIKALHKQTKPILSNPLGNIDKIIKEKPIKKAIELTYNTVGKIFASATYKALNKRKVEGFTQEEWDNLMREFLNVEGADKVVNITETTRKVLKKIVQEGKDEGLSVQELGKKIEKEIIPIYRNRGITIARTEVLASSNWGSLQGAKATGLDLKKIWITTIDDRTRDEVPDHSAMNNQKVLIDEPFTEPTTGEILMFAGDTSNGASARNVINCRCSIGYEKI